jgi:hypothetical protein
MLVIVACLVVPVAAWSDGAPGVPHPVSPVGPVIPGWWSITQMLALQSANPEREIQPDVLGPGDQTRALEFRGAVPNPFHAETAIRFTLPVSAHVTLRLYDVAGKLVRTLVDAQMPPGDHSAMLVAGDMRSGVYFAVLRAGTVQTSRSVVLSR